MVISNDTGTLSFKEAKEAFDELYEISDSGRRFILRKYVLYSFNDEYGRKSDIQPSADDLAYFKSNCLEMIKMDETDLTLKAELYREIGDFSSCMKLLDNLEPSEEYIKNIREKIREHAIKKDSKVFQLSE